MSSSLQPLPTADLNDAYPDKVRLVTAPLRDFGGRRMFAGRIRTAVTMGDTRLVQQALFNTPGDGAVIVLDGGGSLARALLGDVNGDLLVKNGWAGIVINGAIRDVERLADLEIGIRALGTSPIRSGKMGIGALDVPVAFGNVLFQPGHCIYCDKDGILVAEQPLSLPTEGQG